jgi:pilus assembly protein FimV
MLAGLVLVMRKSKPKLEAGEPVLNRLSDDEALRLSIARTREAGEPIEPRAGSVPVAEALASTVPAGLPSDPEAAALEAAVQARPQDLERHLCLLRLHHARGNALAYEAAAQQMRLQVATTMDPRWREAVVMGASLMPGHPLFIPAGWNSPRYSEPVAATADGGPVAAAGDRAPRAAAENVRVFDEPVETDLDRARQRDAEPNLDELDLDSHAGVFGETFGELPVDVHRNEAQVMVEDEASATRIELAKAYLDIGDLDGARSMLEEVLADGAPSAKAEAGRLLKDIG